KFLPVSRVNDLAWFSRFRNEASAGARINHRNVVGAFDMGVHKKHFYIVMEYVEGDNLQSIVERQGPLKWSTAVDFIRQAAEGLAHLHRVGMVHRDVKPSHLRVEKNGVVRLTNLSMARSIDQTNRAIPMPPDQADWETFDFLAPEQARDREVVDPRTDIYSLG